MEYCVSLQCINCGVKYVHGVHVSLKCYICGVEYVHGVLCISAVLYLWSEIFSWNPMYLCSAIHRNPAASSLFIQAIHARGESVCRVSPGLVSLLTVPLLTCMITCAALVTTLRTVPDTAQLQVH